jgi:hypothetical protein
MAFDWRAFTGQLASGLASDIRQRRVDAREFEEEQEDLAERNLSKVQKNKQLANQAAQLGHRARALGATDAQIQNALNSGMNGIADFYNKLQSTVEEKGVKTLGKADIDAIVNMPSIPDVDFEFADGQLAEQTRQLYGFSTPKVERGETDTNVFKTLFGFDAKDRAKARLRNRQLADGMTIAEINAAARQGEYESLFPNATMTFTDVNFFGKKDLRTFTRDINSAMKSAVTDPNNKLAIEQAGIIEASKYDFTNEDAENFMSFEKKDEIIAKAKSEKTTLLKQEAAKLIIENALDTYYLPDLLNNEAFKRMVETTMGPTYLAEILAEGEAIEETIPEEELPLPPEPTSTATSDANEAAAATFETPEGGTDDSQAEGSEEAEDPEEIPSDPEAQKEALLALTFRKRPNAIDARRRLWDKDLEGVVNPDDGKVIIAPPRPPEGGEKTKDLITTAGLFGFESPVGSKKVTEAEYWDATYGDTHDPSTGLPLNMEKLLNADPRLVR